MENKDSVQMLVEGYFYKKYIYLSDNQLLMKGL